MNLEEYLTEEVCFREYPEDFGSCFKEIFGEALFSEYLRRNKEYICNTKDRNVFYDFFSSEGIYQFFLQIEEFKLRNCLKHISSQLSGKERVLDAGMGDATKLNWYALTNPETKFTGVDFSESFIKSARERFQKHNIGNCSLTLGDLADLPFREGSFDLVIADHSLHEFQTKHTWVDQSFAVTVPPVMKVLKSGGKLVGALTMPSEGIGYIMNSLDYFIQSYGGKNLDYEEKVENPEYSSLVLFSAVKA